MRTKPLHSPGKAVHSILTDVQTAD